MLREASERSGLQGAARKLLELEVARTGEPCPLPTSAAAYAFVEERESALECLQQVQDSGWVGANLGEYLKVHPLWDGLRSDPRFTAILKSMDLVD
jgi:hypothetical protein